MIKANSLKIPVVSDESIVEDFISKRCPFVLRGSNIGLCSQKWSTEYLSEKLGKEEVKIHVSKFANLDFLKKNFAYKTLVFEEFLRRASCSEHKEEDYFFSKSEYYYLRSVGRDPRKEVANIQKQFQNVSEDFLIPKFIPKDKVFSSVFRIASKELSVWTHYDVMDNALVQVKGTKQAILFAPTDVPYLYLNGDKSEVLDIEEPDLETFPKFSEATPYRCILEPGDILYIPAFWFHNMKYLDFGIAVNIFWKELDLNLYDKKDTYGNKDLLPAQQAFASLNKALNNLSTLPESYQQFYYLRIIDNMKKKLKI